MTRARSVFAKLLSSRVRDTRSRKPRVGQLSVEHLEDRTVPATFNVNTTVDSLDANLGDGVAADSLGRTSLRAAVMEANALAGADTINLPSATYALTLTGSEENNARGG